MNWKKEYRVSDLFKREGAGAPAKPDRSGAQPSSDPAQSGTPDSMWKKELKLSSLFRRKRSSSAPKEQLALPAPGDTLSEAPAPAPVSHDEPAEQPAAGLAGEAAAAAAVHAAGGPDDADQSGPSPHEDSSPEPAAEEPVAHDAVPDAAVAAAAAAAATAALSDHEAAEGEQAPAEHGIGVDVPPPADEAQTPPAEGRGRRFGRKTKTPKDSGPERREQQPGPGGVSTRKPSSAGQLPQVPLMKALNLLPQDIKLPKTTLRPKIAQIAVAGVAVFVAAGMTFFWWSENQRLDDRRGTVEDLQTQIAALQAEVEAPTADDGTALAGEALARATALSVPLESRVGWDRLLRELSLTLPGNVWFTSMVTSAPSVVPTVTADESPTTPPPTPIGPSSLTIEGFAMTEDDVAELLARLGVVPEFSSIQLQTATEETDLPENVFSFTVIAAMKPVPGGTP